MISNIRNELHLQYLNQFLIVSTFDVINENFAWLSILNMELVRKMTHNLKIVKFLQ